MPLALMDAGEFERWYRQALHTIDSARRDLEERDFAWACFKAQQAGEYAIKALMRGLGLIAIGHSVFKFLSELENKGVELPESVREAARELDRHYTPPRYPDAFPAGSPFEFYDETTGKKALQSAQTILGFVAEMKEALDHASDSGE